MPRREPQNPTKVCQGGCHRVLSLGSFPKVDGEWGPYCCDCMKAVTPLATKMAEEKVGEAVLTLGGALQKALTAGQPDMDPILQTALKLLGGHDGVARSIALQIADMEGRLTSDGKILSHEEAFARGMGKTTERKTLRQYLTLFAGLLSQNDDRKVAAGNRLAGLDVMNTTARVLDFAWRQAQADPAFRKKLIGLLLSKYKDEVLREANVIMAEVAN